MSILCYPSPCWYATRGDMKKLELLQNRTTLWILPSVKDYRAGLAQFELLPIPLYLQMLDILTSVKMCNSYFDYDFGDVFPVKRLIPVCLKEPRTEVMQQGFFVRTCRLTSYISSIAVTKPLGIKTQILRFFWNFFESKYSENNLCSWCIGCRCSNCTLSIHRGHPSNGPRKFLIIILLLTHYQKTMY